MMKAFGHGQWGARSIHEDIHRTYGNRKLPYRDDPSFIRAMEYRTREVADTTKLREEHRAMVTKFNAMTQALEETQLEVQSLQKYKAAYKKNYQNSRARLNGSRHVAKSSEDAGNRHANGDDSSGPIVNSDQPSQHSRRTRKQDVSPPNAVSAGDAAVLDGPPGDHDDEGRQTGEHRSSIGERPVGTEHS
jgi:hypothetical protein